MPVPFVEFFSGIGGFAAAARHRPVSVVAAFDQDRHAQQVYQSHFSPVATIDLCGLGAADPRVAAGRGWWLSPPCQPYSRKGRQRDVDDPRSKALLHLITRLPDYRPDHLLLENVPPFAQSRARHRLVEQLLALDMNVREALICPSEFGIPNRRNRYYLLASREPIPEPPPYPRFHHPLSDYLDQEEDHEFLSADLVARLDPENNIVGLQGVPGVFGSSYGRAIHGAGDYLRTTHGVRRFSPEEILRLLHFPADLAFPKEMKTRSRYKLAGNSVNVEVVGYLLDWLFRR